MKLYEVLDIRPGLTALIGGGGKTTAMYTLGRELSLLGRVILCTTTKIFPPEHIPCLTGNPDTSTIAATLARSPQICIGTITPQGKLSSPCLPMSALLSLAEFVIVEADGSARLPLKAHAPHEPYIPTETKQVIALAGLDGLEHPIRDTVHRPEIFAQLANCTTNDLVTPDRLAQVFARENLHHRVFLNKAESPRDFALAQAVADLLDRPAAVGALQKGEWKCL